MIRIPFVKVVFIFCVAMAGAVLADPPATQTAEEKPSAPESSQKETKPSFSNGKFLITGLHCPPCTSTVEGSLRKTKGVRAIKVDWQTKNALVEFDESVVSAQKIATLIAATPHMMGSGMKYGGWLALRIDGVDKDETAAKAKEVLGMVNGVAKVAVYPKQSSVGVGFTSEGNVTMKELLAALEKAGLKAASFADKAPKAKS
ncbi:MAG: cation transporter [Planctomycetes bacterium]|nr:cation transporter [Planctomycetota bacterium]